tara:strand:- start:282 stop:677 length:396 start_codon:yes stop_codon:yes gene_type:complete
MSFNVPFCTISSYTSTELGNDSVANATITNPITLVITSDDVVLYPITPGDFRVLGAVQTNYADAVYTDIQNNPEIESVTFVQDANKVNVVVELISGFAMNDLNQVVNFCIEGAPAISTTVTGELFNVITNQ